MTSPGSTASLREANQRRVVAALRARRELSQAEIARATGLAPATVSNIVNGLCATGFLESERGAGRRGATVKIARTAGLVSGVDFGHSHVRVALGDLAGSLIGDTTSRLANDHHYESGLELAGAMLDELLLAHDASRSSVRAIGMGLPAPISSSGVIESDSILPGWLGINAAESAARSFGIPTLADNDANLGALAESVAGIGVGHPCMAYLKVASGVGCGLIIDGMIFHGGTGTAGEIGHLTIDEDGPLCRCGSRGCLEAYVGADALVAQFASRHPDASSAQLFALASDGDIGAGRLLEDAGRHLGRASATLVNLLGPTMIVVGGDTATAGGYLLEGMRDGIRRHALEAVTGKVTIETTKLGDRAAVIGALVIALRAVELPH